MTANNQYEHHRETCYRCGGVDLGMFGLSRCGTGKILLHQAAQERIPMSRVLYQKRSCRQGRSSIKPVWKLRVTAEDFKFLNELKIAL